MQLEQMDGPVAVRYPRGKAYCCEKEEREPIVYAKAELLYEGKDVLILAVGNMVSKACEVRKKLAVQRDSSNDCQYAFCEAV